MTCSWKLLESKYSSNNEDNCTNKIIFHDFYRISKIFAYTYIYVHIWVDMYMYNIKYAFVSQLFLNITNRFFTI